VAGRPRKAGAKYAKQSAGRPDKCRIDRTASGDNPGSSARGWAPVGPWSPEIRSELMWLEALPCEGRSTGCAAKRSLQSPLLPSCF